MRSAGLDEEAGRRPAHVAVGARQGFDEGRKQARARRVEARGGEGGAPAAGRIVAVQGVPNGLVHATALLRDGDQRVGRGANHRLDRVSQQLGQPLAEQNTGRIRRCGGARRPAFVGIRVVR